MEKQQRNNIPSLSLIPAFSLRDKLEGKSLNGWNGFSIVKLDSTTMIGVPCGKGYEASDF